MNESLSLSRVELEDVRIVGRRLLDRPSPERLHAWLRQVDGLINRAGSDIVANELRLRCEVARSVVNGHPQLWDAVVGDVRAVESYVSELYRHYLLQPSERPDYLLKCANAVLFCDEQENALGVGLRLTDVAQVARLDEQEVARCLGFLEQEGFVRAAPFGQPDEFLVNDRATLLYYVTHELRNETAHPLSRIEITVGDKYEQNISNSNVGAAAAGPGAHATGSVYSSANGAAWRASIEAAQAAALREQDKLDDLADGMYEAFSQLLRMVRQIQIDQMTAAELEIQIKEAVDEVWAEGQIKKLRAATDGTLEVLRALKGPAKLVAKALVGG